MPRQHYVRVLEDTPNYVRTTHQFTAEELFAHYSSQVKPSDIHNATDIELDLMWDMMIRVFGALVANGTLTLTPEQQATFDKIKIRWPAQKAVDLQGNTYETDWAFDVESRAGSLRQQYYAKKVEFGYPF